MSFNKRAMLYTTANTNNCTHTKASFLCSLLSPTCGTCTTSFFGTWVKILCLLGDFLCFLILTLTSFSIVIFKIIFIIRFLAAFLASVVFLMYYYFLATSLYHSIYISKIILRLNIINIINSCRISSRKTASTDNFRKIYIRQCRHCNCMHAKFLIHTYSNQWYVPLVPLNFNTYTYVTVHKCTAWSCLLVVQTSRQSTTRWILFG